MANDYSAIGFRAETEDDLQRIYEENRARLRRAETPDGAFRVCGTAERMENG